MTDHSCARDLQKQRAALQSAKCSKMLSRQAAKRAARLLRSGLVSAESQCRSFQTSTIAQQQPAPAPSDTIEVEVNGQPVQILKGSTVMAACDAAGVDIPRCLFEQPLCLLFLELHFSCERQFAHGSPNCNAVLPPRAASR